MRPIFDYCDVIYDSARLVTGAHRRSPTNDLLSDVGWETLKTRRTIHKLTELYKINTEHIATPQYLNQVTLPTRNQEKRRTLRNAT